MKYYFLQIFIITLLSGVLSYLLSGKKCENLFRYLASICLLLALFTPIKDFFSDGFSFTLPEGAKGTADYEAYIEGVEQEASARLTEQYRRYIEKEVGIGDADFSLEISVRCIDKDFDVESVTVELYTLSGIALRDQIDKCLKELHKEVVYIEKL